MSHCLNGNCGVLKGSAVGVFWIFSFNSPRALYSHLSLARLAFYLVEQFLVLLCYIHRI